MAGVIRETEAPNEARTEEVKAECFARKVTRVHVHEVVHESLLRHNRHAALILLGPAAEPNAQGRREERTDDRVRPEGELVLILSLPLVLPSPTLRVCHVLAETQGYPRVRGELVLQPVVMVIFYKDNYAYQSMYSSYSSLVGSRGALVSKT